MSLEKSKETALARLRSPMGYLSADIPKKIIYRGKEYALWDIADRERKGELTHQDETGYVTLLRGFIEMMEREIELADSNEEVQKMLKEGLGAKRVLNLLVKKHKGMGARHQHVEDTKRWIGFSKDITGGK